MFDRFFGANDGAIYDVAQQVLRGEHAWLEEGIVSMLGDAREAVAREPEPVGD